MTPPEADAIVVILVEHSTQPDFATAVESAVFRDKSVAAVGEFPEKAESGREESVNDPLPTAKATELDVEDEVAV